MYYDDIDQYVDRFYREQEEARGEPPDLPPGFTPQELGQGLALLTMTPAERALLCELDPAALGLIERVLCALGWADEN